MVTFRSNNNNNNNRRPPFRSNNNRRPPFRRNDEGSKFSNNDNFQRKVPGRNNHNASKLIEKYSEMAREALAQEDRVLSENYFQHADHFTRVQNEQESIRIARTHSSSTEAAKPSNTEAAKPSNTEARVEKSFKTEDVKEVVPTVEVKKAVKATDKKIIEKKSAVS
ncbi:DUF4167 domain-containing protein [Candidatus Pelagibacter sp.]|nr:DUF4167 domain-containing protein [Candidatus Pelagibacter sp.]